MAFESILDPIFSPLLGISSWLAILIISTIITVLTTIAYKYLSDQKRIKELKAEMKKSQKKAKELSKTDPQKAMKLQQEMMGKNMELMKHSFKPTLYTLIPIILIFGWLNAHMAYEPLSPGEPFTVTVAFAKESAGAVTISSIPTLQIAKNESATKNITDGKVSWTLRGDAGVYDVLLTHANGVAVSKEVSITGETGRYSNPLMPTRETPFKTIIIGNEKIRPLKGFPLVGNWGWLGIYILFSLAVSLSLRKAMGVA